MLWMFLGFVTAYLALCIISECRRTVESAI